MDWSDIGATIGKAAPLIGSLLGGPVGGAVGSIVASALGTDDDAAAVSAALKSDPAAYAKVREAEIQYRDHLAALQVDAARNRLAADTARIQAVNTSMQAEANSEHWLQWSWRPISGLLFAPALIAIYVALPVAGIDPPDVPTLVWEAWGALLGITAWHRGVKQRIQAGDGASLGAKVGAAIGQLASKR
jgi:hypothetical protein